MNYQIKGMKKNTIFHLECKFQLREGKQFVSLSLGVQMHARYRSIASCDPAW